MVNHHEKTTERDTRSESIGTTSISGSDSDGQAKFRERRLPELIQAAAPFAQASE